MFFLLLGVIAVASLNITFLLTMMVNDRKPFIGMLMTMGLNRERVARIFSLYGVRLGLIGTGVGVFLGLTIAFFFKYVPLVRLPSVYYDQSLPIDVKPVAVILVCISSFVIAVAASYLPSRRASKLDPIEAIRIGR
jgi:lipoprotein-releasing system permease protein